MGRSLLRWLPAFVIAATLVHTASIYSELPSRMPTHWGINGQPNGWSPRELGAWFLPGFMIFMWLLFLVLPKIDPKKAHKFGTAYHVFVTATLTFQGVIQYAMLSIAQGRAI